MAFIPESSLSSSQRVYEPWQATLTFAVKGLRSLAPLLSLALSRVREHNRRRRAEQELRMASAPELRDLGIGRSEIPSSLRTGRDIDR
jgi:uncharacterized protein YjiS (DUF1127 family)